MRYYLPIAVGVIAFVGLSAILGLHGPVVLIGTVLVLFLAAQVVDEYQRRAR